MHFAFRFSILILLLTAAQTSSYAQGAKPVQQLTLKQSVYSLHQPYSGFLPEIKDTTAATKNYLPLNFYATHLGAACKVELQLEKQIKLPLRIRLGSKDQVDYLEGKFNRN